MQQSARKLEKYRRMGSMEQIFTILNDYRLDGWGPAAGVSKISNLSQIPLDKIQTLWNKIHYKYDSLQAQFLTVKSVYDFDWIYVGCLPFNIVQYDDSQSEDELLLKELNSRYLLLNDLNITETDIANSDYDITKIPPLYRILICGDNLLLSYNHGILDGMSWTVVFNEFLSLLNGDNAFDPTPQKYTSIEQCIDPKYAKSPFVNKLINYCVPSWAAMQFNKFYCNNSFLSTYNPLNFHQDDILRTQYNFRFAGTNNKNDKNNLITFPICDSYNKYDFKVEFQRFTLSKAESLSIKQQCRANRTHISSLLQYVVIAAMIEGHSDVLKEKKYSTVIGNVFSAIPLYREPNKVPFGIHACSYYNIVEYDKTAVIGSDAFWKLLRDISSKLLDRDKDSKRIRNIYKQKFPYMNTKKFMQYAWDDKNNWMGKLPMPSTITNPGVFDLNKDEWKYKVIESFGSANPGVGMGAMYLLSGASVKGIDEMSFMLSYGAQFLSKEKATKIVKRMKQMLKKVASLDMTLKSKL